MSGAVTAAVVGAVVTGAVSYVNGQKQEKAAKEAGRQAQDNANKQAKAADEANNRANSQKPDTSAILSAAQQSGKAGASGTMLTGPSGIDPGTLQLGKSTLLGA